MSLEQKYKEQLKFVQSASEHCHDPLDKALAENGALMARIIELLAQNEYLQEENNRIRTTINVKAEKKDNPNMPQIGATDIITVVARFRDGSRIESRERPGGICDHLFATKVNYIAVRPSGDRFGVYVDRNSRAALESRYRSLATTINVKKSDDILCVEAYTLATGKKLF